MKSLQLFESGIEQRGTRVVKRSNISFKTVEINYGTYKISERIHSKIGENCYLADNATIIGDVVIGKIAAFGLTPYYAAMLMLSA